MASKDEEEVGLKKLGDDELPPRPPPFEITDSRLPVDAGLPQNAWNTSNARGHVQRLQHTSKDGVNVTGCRVRHVCCDAFTDC